MNNLALFGVSSVDEFDKDLINDTLFPSFSKNIEKKFIHPIRGYALYLRNTWLATELVGCFISYHVAVFTSRLELHINNQTKNSV